MSKPELDINNPEEVVKKEPRKSLFVILFAGIYGLVIGAIILMSPFSEGEAQMGAGAGWMFLGLSALSFIWYFMARRAPTHG